MFHEKRRSAHALKLALVSENYRLKINGIFVFALSLYVLQLA